jgi:hypothetical protein
MKKTIIPIIILILTLNLVSAETKQLFDGWIYPGNTTTISTGQKITIELNNDETKIYATIPNGNSVIVTNNTCEIKDYYKICYQGTQFGYRDYRQRTDINQAHVTLSQITSLLTITRTIENTNPMVGEEISITTKITADPEREARNIKFYDNYTQNFKITDITGCTITENSIQWNGDLRSGQTQECRYTIKTTTNLTYTPTAIAYYNNGETDTSASTSETITTQKQALEIQTNTSNTTPNLGEEFQLNITLENTNQNYDVDIMQFSINLPPGIKQTETKGITGLLWNGKLPKQKDNTKQINIKLKTQQTGNQTINLTALYNTNNLINTNTQQITINTNQITSPTILFLKLENTTKQGETKKDVYIQNLDEKITFYNITTTIQQTTFQTNITTQTIPELKPRMDQKIGEITINQTPANYQIKGFIESQTEYGQQFKNEFAKNTTVIQGQIVTQTNQTITKEEKKQEIITKNFGLGGNVYKVSFTKESLIFGLPLIFILIFTTIHIIKKIKRRKDPLGIIEEET